MKDAGKGETEKRKHPRTAFATGRRPTFRTLAHEFEIEDISRSGLKFCCADRKIRLQGWVEGSIGWPDQPRVRVEGIVVRTVEKALGLSFIGELDEDRFRQILSP